MARVTDSEVKAIIDTSRDTTPFINNANLLITEILANSGLSTDRLKMIELYLSAHFVAVTEEKGGLTSSKVGNSSDSFGGDYTQGLNLTRYGQQAVLLDTSGLLAGMATPKKRAEFQVL